MQPLTFEERLILDIWEAVEETCSVKQIDQIQDLAGWAAVVGTVEGLRERLDYFAKAERSNAPRP